MPLQLLSMHFHRAQSLFLAPLISLLCLMLSSRSILPIRGHPFSLELGSCYLHQMPFIHCLYMPKLLLFFLTCLIWQLPDNPGFPLDVLMSRSIHCYLTHTSHNPNIQRQKCQYHDSTINPAMTHPFMSGFFCKMSRVKCPLMAWFYVGRV